DAQDADVARAHAGIEPALGGSRGRGLVEGRPLDGARLIRLEDVAFLHVVEAVEEDAALEALGHLARIVLEALELRDRRLLDDGAVAHDAHLRPAADEPARDHATRNRAEPRDFEQRADLRLAEGLPG